MRVVIILAAALVAGCGFKPSAEGGSGSSSGSGSGSTASSSSGGTSTGGTTGTSGTTSTSGTSTSTGTTSSSSTSGTTGRNSGDCQSSADCYGQPCLEVTPGGYRQCQRPTNPPEPCTTSGYDQCCPDGSVTCPNSEACVLGPLQPYCGGVMMQPGNVCAVDQCQSDADCGSSSICAPAGTLGVQVKACVYAACKTDADCTAHSGGSCAPVADACCGTVYSLHCVYPGGCRSNADCPGGYCATNGQSTSCQSGSPACPL